MKSSLKRIACVAASVTLLGSPTGSARAETLATNNPDLLVKRVFCVDYNVGGVLVNKAAKPFRGRLRVAVRDEEGDVVGRHSIRMRTGAATGARFDMYYINTLDCRRHRFEFTVD